MNIGQQIEERLQWLGEFGKDPKGSVARLLYSREWRLSQDCLKDWIESLGLQAYFDETGNLFARLEGSEPGVVMTGSHIDTVRDGGIYDGQYGIVAGVLALAKLQKEHGRPLRTLEAVAFAEEEGSRFPFAWWGVKSMLGVAGKEDVANLVDAEGTTFSEAIKEAGFSFKKNESSRRDDIVAFFEAHVEQGQVLETEGLPLGVVDAIVGQRRFTITLEGEANHAGTTPMGYRKDPMAAAARCILEIDETARRLGDPMVATVGKLEATPNTANVVPGKVAFTVDARHTDRSILESFTRALSDMVAKHCAACGVSGDIEMWMDVAPVPLSGDLAELIAAQCDKAGLRYKVMHSGAGHDSQIMASSVPTAMIFVPSRKGVSHSPDEYTDPQSLAYGFEALTRALHALAYDPERDFQKL